MVGPHLDTAVIEKTRKSATALRTIGEVAETLGIAQHVLRFWENKFNQIRPQKHRGRRYYRPEDVEFLRQVQHLLYRQGYTIKGVQNYLNSKDITMDQSQPDLFMSKKSEDEGAAAKSLMLPIIPLTEESSSIAAPVGVEIALKDVLSKLCQSRDLLSTALAGDSIK